MWQLRHAIVVSGAGPAAVPRRSANGPRFAGRSRALSGLPKVLLIGQTIEARPELSAPVPVELAEQLLLHIKGHPHKTSACRRQGTEHGAVELSWGTQGSSGGFS